MEEYTCYNICLNFVVEVILNYVTDGTHVGDKCTQFIDTCIDDYAVCNGTVCGCLSGYQWNGTRCSKIHEIVIYYYCNNNIIFI